MKIININLFTFLTFVLLSLSNLYSQTWNNFDDDDGLPSKEIKVKGTSYEYLFPEGIPIEAEIKNNEEGYFIDLKYIWYGTNFDGPVYFSPELEIKIYIKIQNGETYKLTKDLYYGTLRISGNEQRFLNKVFNKTGKIIFILNTKESWSTSKGTDKKFVFSINSKGY
jgi:hypothetical protein